MNHKKHGIHVVDAMVQDDAIPVTVKGKFMIGVP